MTTVLAKPIVHVKRVPHYDLYIGREMRRWKLPDSIWRNDFIIGVDGERADVLRLYEEHLRSRADLLRQLPDLDGKLLACWCAPAGGLAIDDPLICHGQILLRVLREEQQRCMSAE